MLEKTSAGVRVAEHAFDYDLNGNRTRDAASVMNADNRGALVVTTSVYGFDPLDRVASVTKTGAGGGTSPTRTTRTATSSRRASVGSRPRSPTTGTGS